MNFHPIQSGRMSWPTLALLAALVPTSVIAASHVDAAAMRARFEQERDVCNSGRSNQSRATCLREANAAYAEARAGKLDDGAAPYAMNATLRCDALQGDDHRDCLIRMHGGGTTSGSVAEGGIYRELVTHTVGVKAPAGPVATPPVSHPPQ